MKTIALALGLALAAPLVAAAPAAGGDLCLQYAGAGCDLSGDLGFFHFIGAKLPKTVKKAAALHGRACGAGTVTGTAVVDTVGGALVSMGATFTCDGTPGVISADIDPASSAVGSTHDGSASYGAYSLGSSCTVTIVDCATEPAGS